MSELILVNNIQRFCLHDGPGIRSTVFLMGCSLHCPWCANPENRRFSPFISFQPQKCIAREGRCFLHSGCPALPDGHPKNMFSAEDAALCEVGAIKKSGTYYTAEALANEVLRDQSFFCHGGVTLSGGEPLLQASALEPFAKSMKKNSINLCVESCMIAPAKDLMLLLPYADEWYVDMKLVDADMFRQVLGGELALYRNNLNILMASGKKVTIRIPIVPGITDAKENLVAIEKLLSEIRQVNVEIFSVHNLAESKYKELGEHFHYFPPATMEYMEQLRKQLMKSGHIVSICTL